MIKLITLLLWLTSISPRPLQEPTDNAVGHSSAEASFHGISHHLMTDEDVDVSFTPMISKFLLEIFSSTEICFLKFVVKILCS